MEAWLKEVIVEKWSDLGYILMTVLTEFIGGGTKDDLVFGLSN